MDKKNEESYDEKHLSNKDEITKVIINIFISIVICSIYALSNITQYKQPSFEDFSIYFVVIMLPSILISLFVRETKTKKRFPWVTFFVFIFLILSKTLNP